MSETIQTKARYPRPALRAAGGALALALTTTACGGSAEVPPEFPEVTAAASNAATPTITYYPDGTRRIDVEAGLSGYTPGWLQFCVGQDLFTIIISSDGGRADPQLPLHGHPDCADGRLTQEDAIVSATG